MDYYLESEINVPLDNVAGGSVYFGAKHLMAYAQLCLIAEERGRCVRAWCQRKFENIIRAGCCRRVGGEC